MAGVDWYDSGIGFAIPAEHIQQVLPRLKKGEDLYPGQAGISLKGPNLYTGEPIIAACRPKCPAAAAGLKADDRIVEIDGRKIARAAEVKEELGRRYAGDKVQMAVLRGKEQRIQRELELVAKLEPFQHGFLGILPMRTGDEKGVTVRYVYPESPAAAAGIAAGDVLRLAPRRADPGPARTCAESRRLRTGDGGSSRSPPSRQPAEVEAQRWPHCPRTCRPTNCRRPEAKAARASPIAPRWARCR